MYFGAPSHGPHARCYASPRRHRRRRKTRFGLAHSLADGTVCSSRIGSLESFRLRPFPFSKLCLRTDFHIFHTPKMGESRRALHFRKARCDAILFRRRIAEEDRSPRAAHGDGPGWIGNRRSGKRRSTMRASHTPPGGRTRALGLGEHRSLSPKTLSIAASETTMQPMAEQSRSTSRGNARYTPYYHPSKIRVHVGESDEHGSCSRRRPKRSRPDPRTPPRSEGSARVAPPGSHWRARARGVIPLDLRRSPSRTPRARCQPAERADLVSGESAASSPRQRFGLPPHRGGSGDRDDGVMKNEPAL